MVNIDSTNDLIKECTGDIIMSICMIGNTCLSLSIVNNYYINECYIDEDYEYEDYKYNIFYKVINALVGVSLAYPYYILYTKYIKIHLKNE